MSNSYNKARYNILSTVLAFPLNRKDDYWEQLASPKNGDLVTLNCAPASKFYMSWVVDMRNTGAMPEYLLKSIEDGSLCWWSNVGFSIYNREKVDERPEWKWCDKQYDFVSRFDKVLYRENSYIVRRGKVTFYDNDSVKLTLRCAFETNRETPFHYEKTFKSYKKTTMKMMDKFYKDGCDYRKELNNESYKV